jgi:acyl-coenzyme A synthetase/AMP-(fatty) acid ligase|tara:strand:+ start:4378 stop:5871 length:1494 start_codon:yes stop_codon:yes gene_type:complete
MNLYSCFLQKFQNNRKLVFDKSIYSYEDLKLKIDIATEYLNKLKNNNKILVLTDNSYHLGVFLLTIARIGKIIIPVNKDLKEKQILDQISASNPSVIIYSKIFKKIISKVKNKILVSSEQIFNNRLEKYRKGINKMSKKNYMNQSFIITFSSGTTSNPKPILFTQKIKYERYEHIRKLYKIKKRDIILTSSPLDHSLGQRLFFLAVLTGCNLVYLRKYNLKIWRKIIKKNKVSFAILPSNYLKLLKEDLLNKRIKIKKIVSAASDINKSDKLLFRKKIDFSEMYGASEIGTITNLSKSAPINKINSVGKILSGAEVKIFDKRFNSLSAFKIGKIACKTKLQFKGYYNNKILTKRSKVDGFFLTGDLGYVDNDNYLFFVSRENDVIISSGLNIYSSDVEKEINEHKNIKECAVIGLKDDFFGEIVFSICVLKKQKKNFELNLRNFLSNRLANYQQPIGYSFINELPKNVLGKILKRDLKKIYNEKGYDFSKNLRSLLN